MKESKDYYAIKVKEEIIFEQKNDGSTLVVDMDTGRLFEINEMAYWILQSGFTISELVYKISQIYNTNEKIILQDVENFISKIDELQWIKKLESKSKDINTLKMLSNKYIRPIVCEYDMSKGYFSKFISKKSGFDV
ncbi:PqqD family protein [Bacteroides acidifaciens]|uniref:PqqD family protein n=1 Tax=Bacteroides acidifaciens TaxID=85831 RepID=UPI0025A9ED68|nr:PqqD family protein [Bacteroides acidifaciens]